MLASTKKAKRGAESTRRSFGNEPNLSRLASQSTAVIPLITNQLWNRESITRWCGVDCPSKGVNRAKTAARMTIVEPINDHEDFEAELETG
jgi:hypothetical protein